MGSKGQLPLDFFERAWGFAMARHQMCSGIEMKTVKYSNSTVLVLSSPPPAFFLPNGDLISCCDIIKQPVLKSRLAKCRQIRIFAMPVAFTGKYWQIMENTGKYDLQPSSFGLVISIIEAI